MRDEGDSRNPPDQLDRDELRARLNFPPSLDGPLRPLKRGSAVFPAGPQPPAEATSDVLFKLDDLTTQVEKLTDRIEEIGAPQTEAILDALRAQSISQTTAILGEFRAQMTAHASLILEELRAQAGAQSAALVEQLRKRSVSETDAVTEELRALSAESTAAIVHELRILAEGLEASGARPDDADVDAATALETSMMTMLQRVLALVQSLTSTADVRDRYVLARLDQLARAFVPGAAKSEQLEPGG